MKLINNQAKCHVMIKVERHLSVLIAVKRSKNNCRCVAEGKLEAIHYRRHATHAGGAVTWRGTIQGFDFPHLRRCSVSNTMEHSRRVGGSYRSTGTSSGDSGRGDAKSVSVRRAQSLCGGPDAAPLAARRRRQPCLLFSTPGLKLVVLVLVNVTMTCTSSP